jgi:hypothetical protein
MFKFFTNKFWNQNKGKTELEIVKDQIKLIDSFFRSYEIFLSTNGDSASMKFRILGQINKKIRRNNIDLKDSKFFWNDVLKLKGFKNWNEISNYGINPLLKFSKIEVPIKSYLENLIEYKKFLVKEIEASTLLA